MTDHDQLPVPWLATATWWQQQTGETIPELSWMSGADGVAVPVWETEPQDAD